MNNILDDSENGPKAGSLTEALNWWEKHRIIFNLLVGGSGLVALALFSKTFSMDEATGIVFWGVMANVLYSSGFMLEAWDCYYFNGRLKTFRFRLILMPLGTLLYMIVTATLGALYFIELSKNIN